MIEKLSLQQFCTRFDTEKTCANYLFNIKWPHGFVCPKCDHRHAYQINSRRLPLFECVQCHHQTSITVGTIMEGSRTELRKWLISLFLASQDTFGINAVELSKIIKVTYKTAWLILHKIRNAMSEEDTSILLSGLIHVNDAQFAPSRYTSFRKNPKAHPLFIGAAMNEKEEPLYIKIKRISKSYMVDNYILPAGRKEFLDEYTKSDNSQVDFVIGYCKSRKLKKLYPYFMEARKWISRTFHGLGSRHLESYLNEFCCRLNLRLNNQEIFKSIVNLCMRHKPISYTILTRGPKNYLNILSLLAK